MFPITSINGMTILATMGTNLPIATKPKFFIFLIGEPHPFETNILSVTKFSTERASRSRITTDTSMVNIRNQKVTC